MKQKNDKPAEWTNRNKNFVRGVHGTVVGTAVIFFAFTFGRYLLADGNLTITEAIFIGGLVVIGFLASMPWIFMPAMHRVVEFVQARKGR